MMIPSPNKYVMFNCQETEAAVAEAVAATEAELRKLHAAAAAHVASLHEAHQQVSIAPSVIHRYE